MKKTLFICKRNEMYGFETYSRRSAGLFNSTQFIARALRRRGFDATVIEVLDNNCIDKWVRFYNPDVVILEALWVVPEKFDILKKLYPDVKWMCHLHSNMPFLALEGMAMDWIIRYAEKGVKLIANSTESFDALSVILDEEDLVYLPNVYVREMRNAKKFDVQNQPVIKIACFGAVRPLKNHLNQALAAIQFSKEIGCFLEFHVNASRIETGGAPVVKNLRQLFKHQVGAELVESAWHDAENLIGWLHAHIDLGMQVSLTETFNVVNADYVTAGLPSVVSDEVKWASRFNKVSAHSVPAIVAKMHSVLNNRMLIRWNQRLLEGNAELASEMWAEFFS